MLKIYQKDVRLPQSYLDIIIDGMWKKVTDLEIQKYLLEQFQLLTDVTRGFIYVTEIKPGLFFFLLKVTICRKKKV